MSEKKYALKNGCHLEVKIDTPGGAELLILQGSLRSGDDELQANSWLRVPINSQIAAQVGEQGAKV